MSCLDALLPPSNHHQSPSTSTSSHYDLDTSVLVCLIGLMSGHLCDDESVGLCGAGGDQGAAAAVVGAVGRRLCVRWLDE